MMRAILRRAALTALVLAAAACAPTQSSDTELRITKPSILRARVVDERGKAVDYYTPGSGPAPTVEAIVTGFTPIREVVLVTLDGRRQFGLARKTARTFQLDLTKVVADATLVKDSPESPLVFQIVAVDIEGDRTESAPLRLIIDRAAAH